MNIRDLEAGLVQLLNHHEKMLKLRERELEKMPAGSLTVRRDEGRTSYCQSIDGKKRGITTNKELVYALARKKYLLNLIGRLENNVKLLKKVEKNYRTIELSAIIGDMPEYFRNMPIDIYDQHIRRKNKWMDEPFNQSDYKPEEKIHSTAIGLKVRSKSEVIIAERLDAYKIPYRYEQVMYIGKYDFALDFTILTREGIKFWEHCGKVNDKEYIRRHKWKMSMYESIGIVPWKNLIVTYDMMQDNNEVGLFHSRIIDTEIVTKLM